MEEGRTHLDTLAGGNTRFFMLKLKKFMANKITALVGILFLIVLYLWVFYVANVLKNKTFFKQEAAKRLITPTPLFYRCQFKQTGDAGCDGAINLVDYNIWRKENIDFQSGMATPSGGWRADFNKDGRVDIKDFQIWKKNAN